MSSIFPQFFIIKNWYIYKPTKAHSYSHLEKLLLQFDKVKHHYYPPWN